MSDKQLYAGYERTPEGIERWRDRHRLVEKNRRWNEENAANPINALDVSERGPLPETYSLEEMYWHPLTCVCGSCQGPVAKAIKKIRLDTRPIPPAVKATTTLLPALPHQTLLHLRAASEAVQLKAGSKKP